jgi:hypothetical protein
VQYKKISTLIFLHCRGAAYLRISKDIKYIRFTPHYTDFITFFLHSFPDSSERESQADPYPSVPLAETILH